MEPDVVEALTKKIGPLPGYAYVVIGVGGVLVYKRFRSSKAAPVASMDTGSTLGVNTSATPTDPLAPMDINAWALQAAQHLAQTTVNTPGDIATALSNYLSGYGLSNSQQSIVDQAIHANGFPTGGLLPVNPQESPAPYVAPSTNTYTPPAQEVTPPYTPPSYTLPSYPLPAPQIGGGAGTFATPTPSVVAPTTPSVTPVYVGPPSPSQVYSVPSAPSAPVARSGSVLSGGSSRGD